MAGDEPQDWEDRGKAGEVMQRRDLHRALRKGEAGGRTFQAEEVAYAKGGSMGGCGMFGELQIVPCGHVWGCGGRGGWQMGCRPCL